MRAVVAAVRVEAADSDGFTNRGIFGRPLADLAKTAYTGGSGRAQRVAEDGVRWLGTLQPDAFLPKATLFAPVQVSATLRAVTAFGTTGGKLAAGVSALGDYARCRVSG